VLCSKLVTYAHLVVVAFTITACVESYTPVIKEGTEQDFGQRYVLRFSISPAGKSMGQSNELEEGLNIYPGLDALELIFTRTVANEYGLSIAQIKGTQVKDWPLDFATARLQKLEHFNDFDLLLVDMLTKIEGDKIGAGAGYTASLWLVDRSGNAFPGFVPCSPVATAKIAEALQLNREVRCQKLDTTPPIQDFSVFDIAAFAAQEKLRGLIDEAIASNGVEFFVDCVRFPQFSEKIVDFKTVCMNWQPER
jgi:hypothetical protein